MNITPEQAEALAIAGAEALGFAHAGLNNGAAMIAEQVSEDGDVDFRPFDPVNNAEDLNALIEHYGISVIRIEGISKSREGTLRYKTWRAFYDRIIQSMDKSRKLAQLKCLLKVMGIE